MSLRCANGHEVRESWAFCAYCLAPLHGSAEPEPLEPGEREVAMVGVAPTEPSVVGAPLGAPARPAARHPWSRTTVVPVAVGISVLASAVAFAVTSGDGTPRDEGAASATTIPTTAGVEAPASPTTAAPARPRSSTGSTVPPAVPAATPVSELPEEPLQPVAEPSTAGAVALVAAVRPPATATPPEVPTPAAPPPTSAPPVVEPAPPPLVPVIDVVFPDDDDKDDDAGRHRGLRHGPPHDGGPPAGIESPPPDHAPAYGRRARGD